MGIQQELTGFAWSLCGDYISLAVSIDAGRNIDALAYSIAGLWFVKQDVRVDRWRDTLLVFLVLLLVTIALWALFVFLPRVIGRSPQPGAAFYISQ